MDDFPPVNPDKLENLDFELGSQIDEEMAELEEPINEIDPKVAEMATKAMCAGWLAMGRILEKSAGINETTRDESELLGEASFYLLSEKFPQLFDFDGPWFAFFGTIGMVYGPKLIDRSEKEGKEDEVSELSAETKDG